MGKETTPKHSLRFCDSWCSTFPDIKAYTFHQTMTGAWSQIDHTYVTKNLLEHSQKWEINPARILNADHWMVSTNLTNSTIPENGKGRWSISLRIYKDATFKKTVKNARKEAADKLNNHTPKQRTLENNSQTIYAEFKHLILSEACKIE